MPEKRPTCEDCSLWVRRGAKDKTAYGDCRLNPLPVQTHGENDWCGQLKPIPIPVEQRRHRGPTLSPKPGDVFINLREPAK